MDVETYETLRLVAEREKRSPQEVASRLFEQAAHEQNTQSWVVAVLGAALPAPETDRRLRLPGRFDPPDRGPVEHCPNHGEIACRDHPAQIWRQQPCRAAPAAGPLGPERLPVDLASPSAHPPKYGSSHGGGRKTLPAILRREDFQSRALCHDEGHGYTPSSQSPTNCIRRWRASSRRAVCSIWPPVWPSRGPLLMLDCGNRANPLPLVRELRRLTHDPVRRCATFRPRAPSPATRWSPCWKRRPAVRSNSRC